MEIFNLFLYFLIGIHTATQPPPLHSAKRQLKNKGRLSKAPHTNSIPSSINYVALCSTNLLPHCLSKCDC